MDFKNPFAIDRAEQLGDQLFEFFASPKSFEGLLKQKSRVIRGGRGSGKTMFLLYNSYFHKRRKYLSEGKDVKSFLSDEQLIGIHFRANTNFVTAFREKGLSENEWTDLFGHYINIYISQRLCEIVIDINESLEANDQKVELNSSPEISQVLGASSLNTFHELFELLNKKEIELLNFINNIGRVNHPILIGQGLLFNKLASSILKHDLLRGKSLHVFLDEYENLLVYQQKYLNTFIKHPDPVIFDIGMRKEGLKTFETLGESEVISSPHDFDIFDIDEFSSSEYEEFLIETCKKRLRRIPELKDLPNDSEKLDIRFYLNECSLSDELQSKFNSTKLERLKRALSAKLKDQHEVLLNSNDPIILKLHIALLERGNQASELETEYLKFQNGEQSKYKDWIHNNRNGIAYLLLKDNGLNKYYTGFNTYMQLSSGIIRYFIELCEVAFKNAYREGFSFQTPRSLSEKEQTHAAQYVSRYKVNDIDNYTPYSSQLKRFVTLIGEIFERLHRDPKLSEPERNHFSTEYEKLSEDTKKFLKSACLYSCLQKRRSTKDKNTTVDSNDLEFHLNHIYAPFFQISPRKIRKLDIPYNYLEDLISGNAEQAEKSANTLSRIGKALDMEQLKMFEPND